MRWLLTVLLLLSGTAAQARDRQVALDFQRTHPCPSTGQSYGSCPGYIRDHVWPLCAGGADAVGNLQWQTIAEAKIKDRWERRLCRDLRHGIPPEATP